MCQQRTTRVPRPAVKKHSPFKEMSIRYAFLGVKTVFRFFGEMHAEIFRNGDMTPYP